MNPRIGAAVRAIRARLGETQGRFALRLGCKQNTVSQYESGKLEPSRSMLLLLANLATTAEEREPIISSLAPEWTEVAELAEGMGPPPRPGDRPHSILVSEQEKGWVERLLRILRSGRAKPIRAVTDSIDTFFDFCELADQAGAKAHPISGIDIGSGSAIAGKAEKTHPEPSRALPGKRAKRTPEGHRKTGSR